MMIAEIVWGTVAAILGGYLFYVGKREENLSCSTGGSIIALLGVGLLVYAALVEIGHA
jgi:hypothetical protein